MEGSVLLLNMGARDGVVVVLLLDILRARVRGLTGLMMALEVCLRR